MSRELDADARRRDLLIAERIMGAKWDEENLRKNGELRLGYKTLANRDRGQVSLVGWPQSNLPAYTTDPAADYEVLKHIRTLGNETICNVRDAVALMWERRAMEQGENGVWGCTQYLPGDYSRAALKALGIEP